MNIMNIFKGIFILCIFVAFVILLNEIIKNKDNLKTYFQDKFRKYFTRSDVVINDAINPNTQVNGYLISPNTIGKDYTFYRLGCKNIADTLLIQLIIDNIIKMIKDNEIKNNLMRNNPVILIGSSARDFTDFESLKNIKTTDGRNALDVNAFATNKPLPGFLSNLLNKCDYSENENENIIFHQFMNIIMSDGMTKKQQDIFNEIYKKYNVVSKIYDINSYAFHTVKAFFAEMAKIYFSMTIRLDATGGITKQILIDHLPDVKTFLETIFYINPNYALNIFCINCKLHRLCLQ